MIRQPCSSRGVSGDGPVGGARRGVSRRRLVTVRLERPGTPPAKHYDLAARSFAARTRRKWRERKRGPRPKTATVVRREARVPRHKRVHARLMTRYGTQGIPLDAWPAAPEALTRL